MICTPRHYYEGERNKEPMIIAFYTGGKKRVIYKGLCHEHLKERHHFEERHPYERMRLNRI